MLIKRDEPRFPSHLDPDKGSKEWIKKYIKASWEDFKNINTASFYSGRERYDNIRKIMLGKQSMAPYFKKLDIDSANLDKQWLRVTKEPLRVAPKFRRNAISIVEKMILSPKLTAIDPLSLTEKEDFFFRNKARLFLKKKYEEEGLPPSIGNKVEADVETDEELEMFMEYKYKHRFAVEGQQALKVILNNNNFSNINLYNIEQLHDFGFCGVRDFIDANGDIGIKAVDVSNFIVSRCKEKDFSDAIYMGEVYDLSIAEVKELDIDNEISEATYKDGIESLTKSSTTLADINRNVSVDDYESYRVNVLDIEFTSFKTIGYKETVDKNGNPKLKKKQKPTEEGRSISYKVIYTGKWVIGTDIFFGCDLQTNMKRPKANINDVVYARQCYAPELDGMETKSLAEDYIPIVDQTIFTWLQYQSAINTLQSENISVDISALEDTVLEGDDGEKWNPMDIMRYRRKTGILFYRKKDEDGKAVNYQPISVTESATAQTVQVLFSQLMNQMSLFQVISGFNDITDGSTPNERTAIGLAKLSVEATNNSLAYIGRAKREVFSKLCHSILMRIQDSASHGRISGYVNALGSKSVEFWELDPDISSRELGIEIEDAPSIEEREVLNGLIELALKGDQIAIQDALMIKNVDDTKYAEILLGYKVAKYMQAKQNMAMQNSQTQAQIQQQSAMLSIETQKEIEGFKAQIESQKRAEMFKFESDLMDRKYSYELQLKEMEVTGRVEGHRIDKSGKVESADIQKQSKDSQTVVNAMLKSEENVGVKEN